MWEKYFGLRTILPCLLLAAFALALAPGVACGEERIPFTHTSIGTKEMPPVFFTHDKHVEYAEAQNGDCMTCHKMTDDGLSESFMNVSVFPKNKQADYMHATCTECHIKLAKGPRLAECRVCHSQRIASELAGKK